MRHWRKTWYALIGPLMIWVAFIIVTPFSGGRLCEMDRNRDRPKPHGGFGASAHRAVRRSRLAQFPV
jgi:hypothetical protein